jgi:hypothetical protein
MNMAARPNRRTDRRQQLPPDEGMVQMMEPARPVEGRSLRDAGAAARLGAALSNADGATLIRTLLPRLPIDPVDTAGTPGEVVAAVLLDPAYQLK